MEGSYKNMKITGKDGKRIKFLECVYHKLWDYTEQTLNLELRVFPDWFIDEMVRDINKRAQAAMVIYLHWRMVNVEGSPDKPIVATNEELKGAIVCFETSCILEWGVRHGFIQSYKLSGGEIFDKGKEENEFAITFKKSPDEMKKAVREFEEGRVN